MNRNVRELRRAYRAVSSAAGDRMDRQLKALDAAISRLENRGRGPAKVLPFPTRAESRSVRKRTAIQVMGDVREKVMERCGGVCECGCGLPMAPGTEELDHFRGGAHRRSSTTVRGCWMLWRPHHQDKTDNFPDAAIWREKFAAHCRKHGYPVPPLAPSKIGAR